MLRKLCMIRNWLVAPLIVPLIAVMYAKQRKFTQPGGLEQFLEGFEKYMNGEL